MERGTTSAGTAKWLWLTLFMFLWPAVIQLVGLLDELVAALGAPRFGALSANVVVLTIAAWALARGAFSLGAPKTIWIPMFIGAAPFAILAIAALVGAHAVGDFFWISAAVLVPPAAVAIEGHRESFDLHGQSAGGT